MNIISYQKRVREKGDISMKVVEVFKCGEFRVFEIKDEMKEMQTALLESLGILKAQYIIIIIPAEDEDSLDDAHTLAQYIMYNMSTDLVSIIDYHQINKCTKAEIGELDYVILSHEFTEREKGYIFEQLMKNGGSQLNHLL